MKITTYKSLVIPEISLKMPFVCLNWWREEEGDAVIREKFPEME